MTNESTPPPGPPAPPPPPPDIAALSARRVDGLTVEPMDDTGLLASVTALLRSPGRLAYEFSMGSAPGRLSLSLLCIAVIGLIAFGLTAGSMSGEGQYFYAPLKIAGGTLLASLICLPSLFIFTALSGASVKFSSITGLLTGMIALTALLLAGFTPVVWVFTQSTDSLVFIGAIMVIIWFISLLMGLGFLRRAARLLGMTDGVHLTIWMAIYCLVSLQMSCALRPILGKAETILPGNKKFFLQHWSEEVNKAAMPPGTAQSSRDATNVPESTRGEQSRLPSTQTSPAPSGQ